jgi:hypothetical protein
MAFSFRPGGPQVGAVGAPAGVAGVVALRESAAAPAAGIAWFPDDVRFTWLPQTIAAIAVTATTAAGSARIPNLMMGAGGLAGVTVRGRGQLDRGRSTR